MVDRVLGTLTSIESGGVAANIPFLEGTVTIRIEPGESDLEPCLELARRLVSALPSFDLKGKSAASAELLDTYNDDWREYQMAENGRMIDVTGPALSLSEFMGNLRLEWIAIEQPDAFQMGYNSGHLFSGHSILVWSFDAEQFTNISVQLFG